MSSLFALLSAALFAANALCVRLALRGSTAATATLTSVLTNIAALWLLAILGGSLGRVLHPASLVFLAAGAFAPALARLTYYESINIIGVARAATISNTTPLFAAILAIAVLGEHLTWQLGAGTVLVVIGVVMAVRPQEHPQRAPVVVPADVEAGQVPVIVPLASAGYSNGGQRKITMGVLLALNTAVMASLSFMLRKIGLRMLPDPTLAAALTVTGSLGALLPYIGLRARQAPLRADRDSLAYLIAGGLLTTGGFLAYFLALNLGEVVRVTPLSNTTPLFAVALLLAFRQIEKVAPTTVAGAALTVAGILLVVSG